jgi:phosphatidylethanolamine/phosphatidyl-N-methylethanolamine N-methyltransferase
VWWAFGSPMYTGSTLCFLGISLWKGRLAGLVLTGLVAIMYVVALRFEE